LNNYVGNSGVRVRCAIHGRKNLGGVGGDTLGTCSLQKEHLSRCKKTRERNPDIVGGETREAATPAFATDDGAYTTTVLGRLLERKEKATSIFLYVGGVKISKKIW
jgi:hypothetical protein